MRRTTYFLLSVILIVCLCMAGGTETEAAKLVSSIAFKKYEDTLTIQKGESLKLKVKILPKKADNKTLKWTSSKKKIVSVDSSGVIKGRKKGKSTITAATTDGTKRKIKLKVIVGTKVTGITFTNVADLKELPVGKSYTIQPEILPHNASNKKLKWVSSDENVATVDSKGKVTAVGNGNVTITATSRDGTFKKASYTFKVVTLVKSVKLSTSVKNAYCTALNQYGAYTKRNFRFSLDVEISPENASNKKLEWYSSNPSVVYVDGQGEVTTLSPGVAQITAKATDGSNKKNTFTIYVGRIKKEDCKFIAHRGRSEMAPGNSRSAILLALQSNFDYLEFDIWNTADNGFVVTHDESLKECCGVDVKVTTLTEEQAKGYRIISGSNSNLYPNEYIQSLEQVLMLAKDYPEKILCIELKHSMSAEALEKFMSLLQQYEMLERVKIISFQKNNLFEIRKMEEYNGDTVKMEYLSTSPDDAAIDTCIALHAGLGAKYIGLTEAQVEKIHENGLEINVWNIPNFLTVNHMIHTMKVDSVTTDFMFFE